MTPVIPVSLIITTMNEEQNIGLFFEGVRNGSVLPAEIVVCDGGSRDSTLDILESMHIEGCVLRVISETAANIARGRNVALAHATCDIVAVTDAGCIIDAKWLEKITTPLLTDAAVDAVAGGYALIGDNAVQRCTAAASMPLERQNPDTFLPSSRSFAARKAAILDAGGYPEQLTFAGEDTALVLRMKAMGKHFVTRWDAMVQWYTRPTLRGFLRQHWLYGLGDGEARSHGTRYLRTAVKWMAFLALCVFACWWPLALLAVAALLAAYFLYLWPKYGWSAIPLSYAIGGFAFIALKEWSMFAGYLRGRITREQAKA
jgi:glycosyltransferase involved in cell wall biosynthesis